MKGMIHYPVRKPGIGIPLGQKNWERIPRWNTLYDQAPRIRALD